MTKWRRAALIIVLIGTAAVVFYLVRSTSVKDWADREDATAGAAMLSDSQSNKHESGEPKIPWNAEIRPHEIEIEWREPEKPELIFPPYGRHVQPLMDRSLEGDATAALLLYQVLEECRSAFDSRNALEESIERLRQTHSIQLPSWDKPHRMKNPEALEQFVKMTEHEFENCFPITTAQKNESDRWLQIAVKGGNDLATLYYASKAGSPQEAITLLERAWRNGRPESLELLADFYLEAYNNGEELEGHIDSLAAQYAYALLLWESSGVHGHGALSEYRGAISKLTELSENMHEHERNEAIERATELIESNQNCCTLF